MIRRSSATRRAAIAGRPPRTRRPARSRPKTGSVTPAWSEARSKRRTARRGRPVHPITLALVPGTAGVIASPIVADAERDDTDAERSADREHRYPLILIVVEKIVAVDPTAIAFPVHIAPREIVQAAIHLEPGIRRYRRDQGIFRTGAGAKIDDTLSVGRAGLGGSGERSAQQKQSEG